MQNGFKTYKGKSYLLILKAKIYSFKIRSTGGNDEVQTLFYTPFLCHMKKLPRPKMRQIDTKVFVTLNIYF